MSTEFTIEKIRQWSHEGSIRVKSQMQRNRSPPTTWQITVATSRKKRR